MIRVALIGTGGISPVHLNYLQKRDDVEIVALCDIKPENLARRQEVYGGKPFEDYHDLIDEIRPDAMWLCTPPQVRREPLTLCAERGIPVLCEKPVGRDFDEARRTADALSKLEARVQVGYVFRSMPIVQRLLEARADDHIHLVQSFYGCNMGITRSFPDWFYDKAISGGALIDQATHNLDLLRMLMGEVSEVRALAANPVQTKEGGYTIDEVISLSLLFADGPAGSHVHTWVGDTWRNEILLIGEKRIYRLGLGSGELTIEEGRETHTLRQDQSRMYEHENAQFLQRVESGDWSDNVCSFDDALATLELTLQADAAITEKSA
jgi:myo-inositol 2-dehydrogenase / D-chiro-inositol 1-dehydrogenase